jgi:acyl-CoA synthetase (AMP-forming)/AMP-acid ligase II
MIMMSRDRDFWRPTTGKPKGVVYTHRSAYLRARGVAMEVGPGDGSVHHG